MRYLLFLIILSGHALLSSVPGLGDTAFPRILILNSYHKGYSWADQTVSSIESNMLLAFPSAEIRVEYMDTKRKNSPKFLRLLSTFYQEKFKDQHFDLIFACDDSSIEFLQSFGLQLFGTTPIVFSGANTLNTETLYESTVLKNMTGVLEFADFAGTIQLAMQLQPGLKNIVVINDETTTGKYVGARFNTILESLPAELNITFLGNPPLEELEQEFSGLQMDTMVLLLSYFVDSNNQYYDPSVSASKLSSMSPVPVYAVWDFYFNHGILGGIMTSGYLQGESAAEQARSILDGADVRDVPVVTDGANELLVDYRQMIRFGVSINDLPAKAIVKNINYGNTREILLIHSYSADNPWTRNVADGIVQTFAASDIPVNTYTEYMDTKRHTDKPYINTLANLLKHKYRQKEFDLVISSDDNAFNLIRSQRSVLFSESPVVFCGVNYLTNPQDLVTQGFTGVIESYDVLGTIRLGLELFPETDTIYVINDQTTTGNANRKRVDEIRSQLPDNLMLRFSGTKSMQQLRDEVSGLDAKTLVLLMSFTMDKDNYRFSFVDSAKLITSSSSRPVLGFWDFYLGNGIIGGVITRGFDQGVTAGKLGVSVLSGQPLVSLPVVEQSPTTPIIDYEVANSYGVDVTKLPEPISVINRPSSFYDQYKEYVHAALLLFCFLLLIVAVQAGRIIRQHSQHKSLTAKAETDPLTGTKNREYFTRTLETLLEQAREHSQHLTLCYFDLDRLKAINDTFGHNAGDSYIIQAVKAIRIQIRANDPLCRLGGDEFVAILINCNLDKGKSVAHLAEREFLDTIRAEHPTWPAGISYGCSEFDPAQPVSSQQLVEHADQEMYKCKQQKKDRPI